MTNRVVVFDLRGAHRPARHAGPLAIVCGLPVLLRNALVMQRHGFREAILLVRPEDRSIIEPDLTSCRRLQLELTWIEDSSMTLQSLVDNLATRFRLFPHIVYWPAALSFGRFAPKIVERMAPMEGASLAVDHEHTDLGLAVISEGALRRNAETNAAELSLHLRQSGLVDEAQVEVEPLLIFSPEARAQAEKKLLFSLRKDVDGAVAKYDRYISLAISRQLMKLPITPNMITVLAGLAGGLCGLIAAHGGYWWMLIAALLFQLNSILDGIDGEIARAKLYESRLGQWLDTVADDFSNLCFTVGASVGAYHTWGGDHYLVLGYITGMGLVITSALMYHYIITVVHSGDLNDFKFPWEEREAAALAAGEIKASEKGKTYGPFTTWLMRLKFLVRRDSFVFFSTIFALIGQLWFMVWMYAIGVSIVWITIVVSRLLSFRPSKNQSSNAVQ